MRAPTFSNYILLDRLTSGLTLIAKTSNIANSLTKSITNRQDCQKLYLARVKGRFPLNASTELFLQDKSVALTCIWITDECGHQRQEVTYTNVFNTRKKMTSSIIQDSKNVQYTNAGCAVIHGEELWLHLSCPCDVEDPKNGVCKAGMGKAAETAFSVVYYDEHSDTTIVMAKPITG